MTSLRSYDVTKIPVQEIHAINLLCQQRLLKRYYDVTNPFIKTLL